VNLFAVINVLDNLYMSHFIPDIGNPPFGLPIKKGSIFQLRNSTRFTLPAEDDIPPKPVQHPTGLTGNHNGS
jgi:hypothetical protein